MRYHSLFFSLALLTFPLAYSAEVNPDTKECQCTAKQLSNTFVNVTKKTKPGVVFIKAKIGADEMDGYPNDMIQGRSYRGETRFSLKKAFGAPAYPDANGNPMDDFFSRFFGSPFGTPPPPRPQFSQGSGFIVSADGYILTNAHVVKGAEKIEVTLSGGQVLDAVLVGADPSTDVAVIKIEGKDFPCLTLGDSDLVEQGEIILAIGYPFQLESTVTQGIVSGIKREGLGIAKYESSLQIDAAINPGNSGGPVVDLDGNVVGISTAIVNRAQNVGFAIPSNMAKSIMDQLIGKGVVSRGFMGVALQPVDKDIAAAFNLEKMEGVLIAEVVKDSPADKAGLKQGDIILQYNGKPITSFYSFHNDIAMMPPQSIVQLKINRKGKVITLPITLGSLADSEAASGLSSQKLGIEVETLTPDLAKQLGYTKGEEGVVITKVKPGSPAAMTGLRPGFLVLAVNHKKVTSIAEYNENLAEAAKGKRVLLLVRQGNITRFYSIQIE